MIQESKVINRRCMVDFSDKNNEGSGAFHCDDYRKSALVAYAEEIGFGQVLYKVASSNGGCLLCHASTPDGLKIVLDMIGSNISCKVRVASDVSNVVSSVEGGVVRVLNANEIRAFR